ncbi:hypothetical protein TI05_16725, partial [Achromatium sp. WMS3]
NTAEIPVIFITAKTDVESIVKGFAVGGVDYVTKPFQVEELRARVGTHLDLRLREQELRQLNATKDKFIGILAHELKIPLGGIKGFITLLDEQFEQFSVSDIRENIHLTRDAVENLFALVENLLDWSSLQKGPIAFRPSVFELSEILIGVIRECENNAIYKHIALDFKAPSELWVNADIDMVEVIARNLINNAIKFGREHGLARITAEERKEDILVTIEDDGIGIAKEMVDKLFRIDNDIKQLGTYGEVGTGMGLILTKGYIDLHGTQIWLESEVEQGTKVFFTLPKANTSD